MNRILLGLAASILLAPGAAKACGGEWCPEDLSCILVVPHPQQECAQGLRSIQVGNDTWRTLNSIYASYVDASEKHEDQESSDSDRLFCTDEKAAIASFETSVGESAQIPEAERKLLIDLRKESNLCGFSISEKAPQVLSKLQSVQVSEGAKAHLQYLWAVTEAHQRKFTEAIARLGPISTSSGWLGEMAAYLRARIYLIRAQNLWSGSSDKLTEINAADLHESKKAFEAYLERFPTGRFARSARGLRRRVALLARDADGYLQQLEEALAQAVSEKRSVRSARLLIQEADSHLIRDTWAFWSETSPPISQPIFAAANTLYRARSEDPKKLVKTLSKIPAAAWDKYPGLLTVTRAALYSSESDWPAVLGLAPLPASVAKVSAIRMTYHYLRARSADALARKDEAANEYNMALAAAPPGARTEKELPKEIVTFRLLNRAAAGKVLEGLQGIDEKDGAVSALIEQALGEGELDAIAKSGTAAAKGAESTLLRLMLAERRYAEFVARLATANDRKFFEPVETAAKALARNPEDPKGLMNLGYFLQANRINWRSLQPCRLRTWADPRNRDEQKPGPPLGPRHPAEGFVPESPIQIYKRALKSASGEEAAKILHHMIRCFAPGSSDKGPGTCFWRYEEEEREKPPERKAWFNRLKKEFPSSPWAKKLKYYW